MSDSEKSPEQPNPSTDNRSLVMGTLFDITWRMFAPVLGGIGLGLLLDWQAGTKPWGLLGGMAAGLLVTIILIKGIFKKL